MDRPTKYAREVLAGNIVAGRLVRLACKRHLDDLKKAERKGSTFFYDEDEADRALRFFPMLLKHSKGSEWAGKPVDLEDWQTFIIGCVYGWKKRSTGLRRFRTVYVQVARKNGKSTMLAGIGLYSLIADGEAGAEVYSAATKKDQARIIFDEAARMVKASASIQRILEIYKGSLVMPSTNSKFMPLASDEDTLDGLNISTALIDELHAHKTRGVWDVIDTATGARQQPLLWAITTAGNNRNSIGFEQYERSVKTLENIGGTAEDTLFAYIAQLDKDDDWRDEKNWYKANPNLGVSVSLEDLRAKAETAKQIPAALNNFLCKHLNVWVNQTIRWMDMDRWRKCPKESPVPLDGRVCIGGLDLSAVTDLTSVNLEFVLPDGFVAMISHSFMPVERVQDAERRDNVPYSAWIREGWITATPGEVVDYEWVKSYILEQAKRYKFAECCYDPWNSTQIANDLNGEGMTMIECRQGYKSLSEPTKDIMALVLKRKLIHFGNPVLEWAISNAMVTSDPAGNIKLDKSKTTMRIDPAAAMVISHFRGMLNPGPKTSVYAERGVRAM